MADPDAVRKEWARRVTEEYAGWPNWPAPDAADGPRADGSSRGVAAGDLDDVYLRLRSRQHTGETARALREERAYWGLDPADE